MPEGPAPFRRPALEDFIFEGEQTPWLLRKRVLGLAVLGGVAVVALYAILSQTFGWSYEIDAKPLQDWIEERGILAPILFIAVMALSVLFAPIPNIPIFIAAGLIWGPVLGTIYSQAGLLLGSVLAFYVARVCGRRFLPRLLGRKASAKVDQIADSMGGKLVFAARLIPIVNFDFISFAAGLTAMRFWPFFVATFFGTLIPTALAVIAGDALQRNVWITIAIAGAWGLGLVVSAAWFWYRHRARMRGFRRRSATSA